MRLNIRMSEYFSEVGDTQGELTLTLVNFVFKEQQMRKNSSNYQKMLSMALSEE